MEVLHREPLITPNKVDQFRQMVERLKEKLVPINKHYFLFKVFSNCNKTVSYFKLCIKFGIGVASAHSTSH